MKIIAQKLRLKDISEILIGATIIAFPVAVTEEMWDLGVELSLGRILVLLFSSILFLAWFIYHKMYQGSMKESWKHYLVRIGATYLVTFVASAFILLVIDRLPILSDPLLAVKRTILVSFPGTFAATIIDSLD